MCVSVGLLVCLFVRLFVCLFFCLFVFCFVFLFVFQVWVVLYLLWFLFECFISIVDTMQLSWWLIFQSLCNCELLQELSTLQRNIQTLTKQIDKQTNKCNKHTIKTKSTQTSVSLDIDILVDKVSLCTCFCSFYISYETIISHWPHHCHPEKDDPG